MPVQHEFGGPWTQEKLELVREYLTKYMEIFTKNPGARYFRTIYVDAFAGTGYRTKSQRSYGGSAPFPELEERDVEGYLKGSAYKALEVEPPFDQYIFIEQDPSRAQALQGLKDDFPDRAERISIFQEEANTYLKRWCRRVDWRRYRAVVFLDPYGMQVEWPLIEAIAKTRAIDLWLLFPLGQAVNRLLTCNEPPPPEWAQALTRLFGTEDWRQEFYKTQATMTLFGEEQLQRKEANFDSIGRFFVGRLKTVFHSVAERPRPLYNSKGIPLYLLCFAAGNPKGAPTAIRIAQHLLRSQTWPPHPESNGPKQPGIL